jgi:hypothetical protein
MDEGATNLGGLIDWKSNLWQNATLYYAKKG